MPDLDARDVLRLIHSYRQASDKRLHAAVEQANHGDHGAEEIVQLAASIDHERVAFHALGRLWAELHQRWPEAVEEVLAEAAATEAEAAAAAEAAAGAVGEAAAQGGEATDGST